MQTKFEHADQTLRSIEVDWKKREEMLNNFLKQLATPNNQISALAMISEIPKHLSAQFSDLRSGIVKLASEVVCESASLSKRVPNINFMRFGDIFLKETAFYKALGNGNKTIVRHASTAFLSLITNDCVSFETIEHVFNSQKGNKIIPIRENLAEAILVYIQNILKPEKSNGNTMFSTSEMSIKISDEILEKKQEYEDLQSNRKRLKSAMLKSAKEVKSPPQDSKKRSTHPNKLKLENVKFFAMASEFFIKDATQNVRNFGKQIKAEVDKLSEALNKVNDIAKDQIFNELIDENDKFINRELITKPKLAKSNIYTPIPEPQKPIRETFPLARSPQLPEINSAKPTISKPIAVEFKPLGERIIQVLKDEALNARDKSETIEIMIAKEKGLLQISMNQYAEILKLYDAIKNVYLKDSVLKILTAADIDSYKLILLDYLVDQKITRKINYNAINTYAFSRMGLPTLVDIFISKTGEDYVSILNKNVQVEELEAYLETQKGLTEKLILKVIQNTIYPKRKFDDPVFFDSENMDLFEKIMQCGFAGEVVAKMPLDKGFMLKIQSENPSLYKFIVGNQRKKPDELKSTHENVKVVEREPEVHNNQKLDDIFKKSNPEIRKDLLKSLLPHITRLSNPTVNELTKEKIATKTIEIIRYSFDYAMPTEFETIKVGLQIISTLLNVGVNSSDTTKLSHLIFDVCRKADVLENDRVICQVSQILAVNPGVFRDSLNYLDASTDKSTLVFIVNFWLRVLGSPADPGSLVSAQKSVLVHLRDMIEVAKKKSIMSPETLARKSGVLFLARAYFLVDKKTFDRYIADLTSEQKALVMVYVQKELKQNL